MTNQAKISLLSPSFFIIFMPTLHGNETLELPEHFAKENWESLSEDFCLQIPTGEKWKMKMKKINGKAWLYNGWRDFVQKYSIDFGYLLLFRYQEKSNFIVQIFDLTTRQIEYPNTNHQKEVEFVITEEREMDNHSTSVDLRSQNPSFSVIMRQGCVINSSKNCYMHIPSYARSYFHSGKKNDIYLSLEGENGKVWSMKYYIAPPPNDLARISPGWREFAKENNLTEGDICTFEPLSSTYMIFKVTISRKTDQEAVSLRGTKRKKEKCKGVECNETAFTATVHKTQVERNSRLSIPRVHSKRHLEHGDEIFLHVVGGETWRVKCNINGLNARFIYGWKDFVLGNDLQVGDSCVFELIPDKKNHYKVAVFSGAECSGSN